MPSESSHGVGKSNLSRSLWSFEAAAREALESVDCEKRAIDGVVLRDENWPVIREFWIQVALTLLTDARLDCKRELFDQRLKAVSPFEYDGPEVKHRIHYERCLWAIYSLDFEALDDLLDDWRLENCDPVWMLRKAALLTEVGRVEESRLLLQNALQSVRRAQARNPSIANASRESWALASSVHFENQTEVFKRWDELASLKCNAWTVKDRIERAIGISDERRKAPSFELGVIHTEGIRISDVNRRRLIATYRAVRLLEIAGLPPSNNPPSGNQSWPVSMASRAILLAADELVATAPELAIRLVLRFCNYDQHDTLKRVLSRARIAVLSSESAESLAADCIGLIRYALPRLRQRGGRILGAWVERMRVALEALSRLVLRLAPDTVEQVLNLALEYYRTPEVARDHLLARPASNLLERSWDALPNELRVNRALDLIGAPMSGLDGFSADREFIDPGRLVSDIDLPTYRTTDNDGRLGEIVRFLVRGLKDGDEETRGRATMRFFPLAKSGCLTDSESSEIADALWGSGDPIHDRSDAVHHLDWVYFVLPEMKHGQAEQSFRNMWLTASSERLEALAYAGMSVAQVGAAIEASQRHGFSLALSDEEQERLIACVLQIADALCEGAWHSQGVALGGNNQWGANRCRHSRNDRGSRRGRVPENRVDD